MGDEFYSILKLVSGEEIFALVCVDESEDEPILILHNPIKMKPLHPQSNQLSYIKVTPWMELSDDKLFIIKPDKIMTMTETEDMHFINIYNNYISDAEEEENNPSGTATGESKLDKKMGYLSTVEEARVALEDLYKLKDNKES